LLSVAARPPRYGIFASWTAALVFSIVPVNLLIFRRLLPAHARGGADRRPPRTQLARYVSADWFASLWWLAATALMPVIVFGLKGAEPTAWFSLAWMVAFPLFLMSISGGAALVVSGAREEQHLDQYARQARRQTLLLVTPAALVLAAIAPYVLDLFGPQYSAGATATLRLLCLAAIPNAVVALAVSARRVRRHVRAVVAITASQCALVLVLSILLLHRAGVVGVGAAWLLASAVVAAAVLAIDAGGLRLLSWVRATPGHRRRTRHAAEVAPAILGDLARKGEPTWTVHRSLRTVTDMAVMTIGPPGERPRALIKLATSPPAARSLEREGAALRAVRADERLGTWRDLVPDVLAHGGANGSPYLVEHLLPGRTGPASTRLVECAAAAIAPLHRATAAEIVAGSDCLRRWIDGPLGTLAHNGSDRVLAVAVERLACDLGDAFVGKRLAVSWIHGDYVPSNILVDHATAQVTGIVDWELARPADLPLVDIVSLLLAARMQSSRNELGRVVSDWLAGARWTADEQRIVDAVSLDLPGEAVDERALVLLCWLRHVSANLSKASRYATQERWRSRNVVPVARAVARS
jgi:Phosphotransferase enzyme family